MALTVVTRKNFLPTTQTPFVFRSRHAGTIEWEDIIDKCAAHHTTVTKADCLAVLTVFAQVLEELLLNGNRVKTPFAEFAVLAAGCAVSQNAVFSPKSNTDSEKSGHRFELKCVIPAAFKRRVCANVSYTQEEWQDGCRPRLDSARINGLLPEQTDGTLCGGDVLAVYGRRLRFDGNDGEQGVFICNAKTRTAVRAGCCVLSQGTVCIVRVPDGVNLPLCEAVIELRSRPNTLGLRRARLCPLRE